jgi:hypothetical protein
MAHGYSTDSPERRYIPFFIAAVAIAATFVVFQTLREHAIEIPWWLSPPETMAFYGLLYLLFDKYLWKWSVLHRLRIIRVVNLAGVWRGKVTPADARGASARRAVEAEITLTIRQTWTTLLVSGRAAQSRSRSTSGNLLVEDEQALSYEYVNEPSATAPATMHVHRGMARLVLNAAGDTLEGDYYSGRGRQNCGTVRVSRSGEE